MAKCAHMSTGNSHEGLVTAISPMVFINNNLCAVIGNPVVCEEPEHAAIIAAGSDNVFAGSSGVARDGDLCTCTATLSNPVSINVFVNENNGGTNQEHEAELPEE